MNVKPPIKIPAKNLKSIRYSGLKGRIVHYPATTKAKQTFVIIAGQHGSHERMLSFIEFLADYGDVYSIDMPGFGGMNSFASIGKPISHESYAEYLYAVLKTQKLTSNITIFAVSIGGQFATRMMQMYPDSQKWVKTFVGFVTFGAGKDFCMKHPYRGIARALAVANSNPISLPIFKLLVFNRLSVRAFLHVFSLFKRKMKSNDPAMRKKSIEMEFYHWMMNDRRTHAKTTLLAFNEDLRVKTDELIKVPMRHILTANDQYVDDKEVNKTFRDLFSNYTPHYLTLGVHMPSAMGGKADIAKLFSQELIDEIIDVKGSAK